MHKPIIISIFLWLIIGLVYVHASSITTLPPFSFVKYCVENPRYCEKGAVEQTTDEYALLNRINILVNHTMESVDEPIGQDVWHSNGKSGDCEDFALTKRKMLIDLGIPQSALRIATAYTNGGLGHAVLVVKTEKGDVVLDNLTDKIKIPNKANLRFVKISSENPFIWFSMN